MGFIILSTGIVYFILLYQILLYCLRKYMSPKACVEADVCTIVERVVSAVQAVTASISGLVIVLSCSGNPMSDRHWLANTYAWFAVPYFYFDVYAMYRTYWSSRQTRQSESTLVNCKVFLRAEPMMMIHHIILPVIFFPIVIWYRKDQGDFFLGCLYLFELVIPFISTRAILKQLKLEDTIYYIVNGVFLIVTYILCRILIFPFMYWRYSVSENIPVYLVPGNIPLKCNLASLGLLSMQLYWLVLILRLAYQTVTKKAQKPKVKQQQQQLNGTVRKAVYTGVM